MSDDVPETVSTAAASRDAFDPDDGGYRVTSTPFEGRVTAAPGSADWQTAFAVTVLVPTLDDAVAGEVGDAVQSGWLDTLERRLEDAPTATRTRVELSDFGVRAADGTVTVRYEYELGDAGTGLDVAKTFVEYVEGTYVEGVVPGYDYESPVADLLSQAGQNDGGRGGTPL